jgi:hypothetical protein
MHELFIMYNSQRIDTVQLYFLLTLEMPQLKSRTNRTTSHFYVQRSTKTVFIFSVLTSSAPLQQGTYKPMYLHPYGCNLAKITSQIVFSLRL